MKIHNEDRCCSKRSTQHDQTGYFAFPIRWRGLFFEISLVWIRGRRPSLYRTVLRIPFFSALNDWGGTPSHSFRSKKEATSIRVSRHPQLNRTRLLIEWIGAHGIRNRQQVDTDHRGVSLVTKIGCCACRVRAPFRQFRRMKVYKVIYEVKVIFC